MSNLRKKSCIADPEKFVYLPEKCRILTKLSHINQAMLELKSEVYDNEGKEECHFVRILRVGPDVKNKDSITPGKLAVIHKSNGHYLEKVSKKFGEDYILIKESDILAFVDL